jgi:D-alanyl-D-alanine carboxypeptidase
VGINKYMKKLILLTFSILLLLVVCPTASFALSDATLLSIFSSRGDLQAAFDAETYLAKPDSAAGILIDLEDWAVQSGWREYASLAQYGPGEGEAYPIVQTNTSVPAVDVAAYLMLDRQTGQIIAAKHADVEWPIASITKLMTAYLVSVVGVPLWQVQDVTTADDVGGAKLWVYSGDTFTVEDLYYATLVGSANNAANALARSTGWSKEVFIGKMNEVAVGMNLPNTAFEDPTGIELGNVSTAREVARLATTVFNHRAMRRYTTTATTSIDVLSQGTTKTLTNTNWMLWKPEYDDVYVMSGKTGYLIESGWNLVVSLRPNLYDTDREVLMVIFGANSRAESFVDARALADWAWENHSWVQAD